MVKGEEILDVVDENDNVVRQEKRSIIHRDGLFHRIVQILFITHTKNVILQKRSIHKDTNPGLLSATVGGHVNHGETYEDAAVRELAEETGLTASISDFKKLGKIFTHSKDSITNTINNSHRVVYGYIFDGNTDELVVEKGDGAGFVCIPYDTLITATSAADLGTVTTLLNDDYRALYPKLLEMVN